MERVGIKENFLAILKQIKQLNLPFKEGKEKFKNEFDQFQVVVNKFVEETVYQDKKIFIA